MSLYLHHSFHHTMSQHQRHLTGSRQHINPNLIPLLNDLGSPDVT